MTTGPGAAVLDRPGVRRADRRIDAVVLTWVVLWLVLGSWTGVEVWRLSELTRTVEDSGRAIDSAGEALVSLDPVPVVGDRAAELGTEIRSNAVQIVEDAEQARGAFRRLAVLLGAAVALVPSVPLVVLRTVVRRTRSWTT